jgi:hypothetical protein
MHCRWPIVVASFIVTFDKNTKSVSATATGPFTDGEQTMLSYRSPVSQQTSHLVGPSPLAQGRRVKIALYVRVLTDK